MSTSNWSNANYSQEAPMMTNGRPMMAGLVPILCLTDPGTAEQWSKTKNAFFEAGSRVQLHNINHGELVWGLADQPHFSGQMYARSHAGGYDGPYGVSFSAMKAVLEKKLPGIVHKKTRERYMAELATATAYLIGTAINSDAIVNPRTGEFNHKAETTVQQGGLDSFWNEMDFMKTRQVVRARFPTETEIRNRMSIQQKCQGIDAEKITMIVEASDPMSFSQRHNALTAAYMRAPEIHMQLAVMCRNRIAAAEILAFELMVQADLLTSVRAIGWALDTGIARLNGPHTNAEIARMMRGELPDGAPPTFTEVLPTRGDTADFKVNPLFAISPFVCRPLTRELVIEPLINIMTADPTTIPVLPADRQNCIAAYRSEDFEPILASLLHTIPPTDSARDDSRFGGTVKKFKDYNEGEQFCAAFRTGLLHRLYTNKVEEDARMVRFWPGSYRNTLNQLDNRFYTTSPTATAVGLANRTPDTTRQTGLYLAAIQVRSQTAAMAYASMWSNFHATCLGVVAEGAAQGNRVTFIHSNSGTN